MALKVAFSAAALGNRIRNEKNPARVSTLVVKAVARFVLEKWEFRQARHPSMKQGRREYKANR
jgi:hypothetical protein